MSHSAKSSSCGSCRTVTHDTTAVAALNMDDAGQIQAAAAMCLLILYTNLVARLVHAGATRLLARTQRWRRR